MQAPWHADEHTGHRDVFTDGSGGQWSSHGLLRRVGWAAVCIDEPALRERATIALGASIMGPLAGGEQTVPRGELTAAAMAMKATGRAVSLRVVTDCAYVSGQGTNIMEGGDLPNTNRDLWLDFELALRNRTAPTLFIKIKANQEERELMAADWGQWRMAAGNALAGECADLAAELRRCQPQR